MSPTLWWEWEDLLVADVTVETLYVVLLDFHIAPRPEASHGLSCCAAEHVLRKLRRGLVADG